MNPIKKAVVILTPGFPKDEQDTTCIPFLQDYVTTLLRNRPDINLHVITFQYPYKEGSYRWKGGNIYSAGGKNSKYFSRLFTWRRVMAQLRRIRKEHGISVIHSFWLTEAAFIGQRFAKKHRIKHIAYGIGQDVRKQNRYLQFLPLSKINLVASSENTVNTFFASTGIRIPTIISAGLDVQKVKPTDMPKTIDILGVGALTELKNYSLFLDIINELKRNRQDIKSAIIGKGEQEHILRTKIKALNLENNVQLLGEMPHSDVFSVMNKSKILLHTSGYEGQSTVAMEALAMGLTVVCFDVGRLHVEGRVIVCNDKSEMVNQLQKLLNSPMRYEPVMVRTTDDMVNDFLKLYEV